MSLEPRRHDEDMTLVWEQFKRSGGQRLRDRLIERYLYLVKVIGNRVAARLPEGARMEVLGDPELVNGTTWIHVRPPDGQIGFVPGQYLAASPPPTPTARNRTFRSATTRRA